MRLIRDTLRSTGRREQRRRFQIALIAAPAGLAILLVFAKILTPDKFIYQFFAEDPSLYVMFVLSLTGASGAGMLMLYLQTGFSKSRLSPTAGSTPKRDHLRLERAVTQLRQDTDKQVEELRTELERIGETERLQVDKSDLLDEEHKNVLVEAAVRQIQSRSVDKVLDELKSQIADADKTGALREEISERFEFTFSRLREELLSLSRRGNTNLVLGVTTTVSGLGVLGFFVYNLTPSGDMSSNALLGFAPRLSLVIFIEVFAYFFLRLYKLTLAEIKYFQNELTNVESKAIALHVSVLQENSDSLPNVISQLAATERNSILEKGQTTVELERTRLKDESLSSSMKDFFARVKPNE